MNKDNKGEDPRLIDKIVKKAAMSFLALEEVQGS